MILPDHSALCCQEAVSWVVACGLNVKFKSIGVRIDSDQICELLKREQLKYMTPVYVYSCTSYEPTTTKNMMNSQLFILAAVKGHIPSRIVKLLENLAFPPVSLYSCKITL